MDKHDRSRVLRFSEPKRSIPGPAGEHAAQILKRGPLDVALSIPRRPTQQTPHVPDEIYFIVRGRALFLHDGKHDPVGSGDLMFVAAGPNTNSRTTPRISRCGASSMAPIEARSQHRLRRRHRYSKLDAPGCQARSAR